MNTRRDRIREINKECEDLNHLMIKLNKERDSLLMEQSKEDHSCTCVKLNRDIEIYDMGEQERRGRRGLGFGMVSDTLSCRKDCTTCKGTGIPGGRKDDDA
jgi:hypothetical protein